MTALDEIDAEIAALHVERTAVIAEQQAACEHAWTDDILHYRGLYCPKCQAADYSDACSRIDWRLDLSEWPYDVPPQNFCWKHKQAASECVR